MRNILIYASFGMLTLSFSFCKSGLVTTTNSCYNLIQSSKAQNKSGDYSDALANFNEVLKKCDAYDAKEAAYAGKAEALNGLQRYDEALDAANAGLKVDKNSIDNFFQKASAELGLGRDADAKADLQSVIALTEKNRNTAQRATIFAKMAAIDSRAQMYADAQTNIRQAISLDPNNASLYVLQGDINTSAGDFSAAQSSYDMAIEKGGQNAEAWKGKLGAMIKAFQQKYSTSDANVLAAKLSPSEKQNLCENIKRGIANGMKDVNVELLQVKICK